MTSVQSVILNNTNLVQNSFNNTYAFDFTGSTVSFKDAELALAKIYIYNSWFNVNATLYANQTFSLSIPYNGANFYTLSITLPNGYYGYQDLQNYIENQLIAIGAYLINAAGQYVYGINLTANATYYAAEIDLSPAIVQGALPAGWGYATSGLYANNAGLPTTANTIQMTWGTSFGKLIGAPPQTFPASLHTTTQTFLSTQTPVIAPVQSLMVRCSLCTNPMMLPSDVIYTLSTNNTQFGQLIVDSPTEYQWNRIPDQSTNRLTITLTDQNFNFVQLQDANIVVVLLIKQNA
jgi:hypothetical protein